MQVRKAEREVEKHQKFSGDVYTIKVDDTGAFHVYVNDVSIGLEATKKQARDLINAHFFYRLQTAQRFPA
jgi:hypothetical protein